MALRFDLIVYRHAAVATAVNHRYPDALAVVDDPALAYRALDRLTRPVHDAHGRASRPFNPGVADDLAFFTAVRLHLRGPVAKISRSRRWRVTQLGHAAMSAAVMRRRGHASIDLSPPT